MLAALLPTLGPLEMVVLLLVILIFFGVGKLPEVGKALGASLKSFKEAQRGDAIDVTTSTQEIDHPGTSVGSTAPAAEKEKVV
jgi:sec-independent protein translocase protein TatA